MELLRYITREEQIAGLEIRDDFVRLAFIAPSRTHEDAKSRLGLHVESPVPAGTIVDGKVADSAALIGALKDLSRKAGPHIRFVVATIPPYASYLKHFAFPKSVSGRKLDEAMQLAIDFELPMQKEKVLLDWEGHEGHDSNDTTLVSIPREVGEGYLACLKEAGFHAIALELRPHSVLRAAALAEGTYLMVDADASGMSFAVVKDREIVFLRTVLQRFLDTAALANEEQKMVRFCTSRYGAPTILQTGNISLSPASAYAAIGLGEQDVAWLAALGALMRALLPRHEDTLISLTPVGTEQAYEYQRAAVFSTFAAHLTISIALFFVVGWLASFALLVSVQQNFSTQINGLSHIPLAAGAPALEQRAADLNSFLAKTSPLVKKMPLWSALVADIYAALPSTVTVTNLSVPSPEGTIQVSGIAADRTALNNFKKTLQAWSAIRDLNFPVQNITQRDNIPFSVSFALVAPQKYYPN